MKPRVGNRVLWRTDKTGEQQEPENGISKQLQARFRRAAREDCLPVGREGFQILIQVPGQVALSVKILGFFLESRGPDGEGVQQEQGDSQRQQSGKRGVGEE